MTTTSLRNLRLALGATWLVVAGYGLRELIVADGDDWELAYTVFSIALLLSTMVTLMVISAASRNQRGRSPLRVVGLAVTAVGCAACVVAWALPLWMVILGTGIALTALASDGPARRSVAFLAGAQFAGVAVQFTALGLGAGEGVAADVALIVTSAAMAIIGWSRFGYLVPGGPVGTSTAPTGAMAA